jgi:NAD(P)H-hydrate epimerase
MRVILKLRSAEEGGMIETDLARQLEGLFHEVGEAHHQAYIETDGADPEWPLWYADYLRERLGRLLDASFTKSELVHMLVSGEQPLKAPGANWARYYAGFFIRLYT